jgi:hypothetical protein
MICDTVRNAKIEHNATVDAVANTTANGTVVYNEWI